MPPVAGGIGEDPPGVGVRLGGWGSIWGGGSHGPSVRRRLQRGWGRETGGLELRGEKVGAQGRRGRHREEGTQG